MSSLGISSGHVMDFVVRSERVNLYVLCDRFADLDVILPVVLCVGP